MSELAVIVPYMVTRPLMTIIIIEAAITLVASARVRLGLHAGLLHGVFSINAYLISTLSRCTLDALVPASRGVGWLWGRIDLANRTVEGVSWALNRLGRTSAPVAAPSGDPLVGPDSEPVVGPEFTERDFSDENAATITALDRPHQKLNTDPAAAKPLVKSGSAAVRWLEELTDRIAVVGVTALVSLVVGITLCAFMISHVTPQSPWVVVAMIGGVAAGWLVGADNHRTTTSKGLASRGEMRRTMGASAMRKSAAVTRPMLERPGRWPVTHYAVDLCKASGRRLYVALKEVILIVAPPQTGKTALMGNFVIDAPGAAVVTSTKTDIYDHTASLRKGPVMVFNPEGLGGIASTLRWSPISGCHKPATVLQRTGYLLSGTGQAGISDQEFWVGMNARLLRSLLYAAAVSGSDMSDVYSWIGNPGDETPLRILEGHDETPPGWAEDLNQIMTSPQKTKESVYLTLSNAFQWMADPALARSVCPKPGEEVFSMRRFLEQRGTLYLLGAEKAHGGLGALFSALTGHIFEQAKIAASMNRTGRLDPPLLMALDEAALICPVPLDRWTSDSGGRGIVLAIAVQSPSQLYERWGERGGQTVWNNANVKVVFGGLAVAKDLEDLSTLCGERDEQIKSYSTGADSRRSVSESVRRVPVLPPHAIRQLRDYEVLILRRNVRPILGRIRPVWDRSDVKRHKKFERTTARRTAKELATPPVPKALPKATAVPLRPLAVLSEHVESQPAAAGESS